MSIIRGRMVPGHSSRTARLQMVIVKSYACTTSMNSIRQLVNWLISRMDGEHLVLAQIIPGKDRKTTPTPSIQSTDII